MPVVVYFIAIHSVDKISWFAAFPDLCPLEYVWVHLDQQAKQPEKKKITSLTLLLFNYH